MPDLSGKGSDQGLDLFDADWRATSSSPVSKGCPNRSLTTAEPKKPAASCAAPENYSGLREAILVLWRLQLVIGDILSLGT